MISTGSKRTWLTAACLAVILIEHFASATNFYVNNQEGKDTHDGATPQTAIKTLEKASKIDLKPGDQLLFKSGDVFHGMLQMNIRGASKESIRIGSYGEGKKPIIDAKGEDAAIHLINPSFVTIEGLEIKNEEGRYGVNATAENQGALGNVTIRDMDIHHVYMEAWNRPENDGHGDYKYNGGIHFQIHRGDHPSWWEEIVIKDNRIHDLGTCGISIGSDYSLHEKRRRGRDPFPIKGVLIDGNTISDIARDGTIIRQCEGAILQNNRVVRTGRVSISNGIWFWDCRDSVIRYNIGTECGVRGMVDGGPFSIDYYCTDCRIESNYSYNNEGPGFMAFGNHQTGKGSVMRGNVSYNDARAESRPGFAAVSMISELSGALVENNTIIAGPDTRVLLGHHHWQGMPSDVLYRGNVFIGNNKAGVETSALTGGRFEGNLFFNIPNLPETLRNDPSTAADAYVQALKWLGNLHKNTGADRN